MVESIGFDKYLLKNGFEIGYLNKCKKVFPRIQYYNNVRRNMLIIQSHTIQDKHFDIVRTLWPTANKYKSQLEVLVISMVIVHCSK